MFSRNESLKNNSFNPQAAPIISQSLQLSQTSEGTYQPPPLPFNLQHQSDSNPHLPSSANFNSDQKTSNLNIPQIQTSIQARQVNELSFESSLEHDHLSNSGSNAGNYPHPSSDNHLENSNHNINNNNNHINESNSQPLQQPHQPQGQEFISQSELEAVSLMEELRNHSEYYEDDSPLEMSKFFLTIYEENSKYLIITMCADVFMGGISWYLNHVHCNPSEEPELYAWNEQWMWYFFGKMVYHFCIFLQHYSPRIKLEACDTLGEYRSGMENIERELEFDEMTEGQQHQTRLILEKQLLDFLYRRNFPLKIAFLLKLLVSLAYIIYGLVVFFQGDFFIIWSNNSNPAHSCQYYLTLWLYISIIIVISCNRELFDLVLSLTIILPITIIVSLPYMIFKSCQLKSHRNRFFKKFKSIKYAEGKVQGDAECAICRMEYVVKEKIIVLPCNPLHHFHDECIRSWLNVNKSCPLCRFNLDDQLADPLLAQNENTDQLVQQHIAQHQPMYYDQHQYVPPHLRIQERSELSEDEGTDDDHEEEGGGGDGEAVVPHRQFYDEENYDHRENMLAGAEERVLNESDELQIIQSFCKIFQNEQLLIEFLASSEFAADTDRIVEIYRDQQQQQQQQYQQQHTSPNHNQESN